MVIKTLTQVVLCVISLLMIGTFLLETANRWSSSKGPLVTARLTEKAEIVNHKAASNTFKLALSFRRKNGDSATAITEVSQRVYAAHRVGSLIAIHYQPNNPGNAVVAEEGWFEWKTLVILAFGLVLLFAAVTVKEGTRKHPV